MIIGLCLIASVSYGQKKAVTDALRLANDSKYAEARNMIKGALENAETKDDVKTWFTAGKIENLAFTAEKTKLEEGKIPDFTAMYNALLNIYPFYKKTLELDKIPDAKGKVKPKYTKEILNTMKENMQFYFSGGGHFMEVDHQDYKKSFVFFDQIIEITDNELWPMKKVPPPPTKEGEVPDSTYMYATFYAAAVATMIGDEQEAIRTLERACKIDYKRNESIQLLCEQYEANGDTVNYLKKLEEGIALFPNDQYYVFRLVNIYIALNQNEQAIEYLNTAIQADPSNAQLYLVSGKINELLNNFPEAEKHYQKTIELEPDNPEANFNLGGIYFNQGANNLDEINKISDSKKYNEEKEIQVKPLFKKALPYFEKAYQLKPDVSSDILVVLRNIYYNLEMEDKLAEIQKSMPTDDE